MLRPAIVLTTLLALSWSVNALGEKTPDEGSYYKYSELGISKTDIKGDVITIHFKPKDEQFYWCPGIKVQTTAKATAVTFVRTKTSEDGNITKKAGFGKHLLTRHVTFNAGGKDTYVRAGAKKFKRIYKVPKKDEKKKGKQPSGKQPGKPQADPGKDSGSSDTNDEVVSRLEDLGNEAPTERTVQSVLVRNSFSRKGE